MRRTIQAICASSVLVMLLPGCDQLGSVSSYLAVENTPNGRDRVVAGPVEKVAIATQNSLEALGCTTNTTTVAEEIRIAAKNAHAATSAGAAAIGEVCAAPAEAP